ncbi:MAG: hypothetical protein OEV92_13140 [Nitrospinota bacterium]|nr:hypothetical protein [Nitrospinota bacterium]
MGNLIAFKSILAAAVLLCFAGEAVGQERGEGPKIHGYLQFLVILHEEGSPGGVSDSGGALAGFQERRARIGARGRLADGFAGYNLMTEWAANTPAVVDFWGSVHPTDGTEILFGRFKPYLSAEMFAGGVDLPNLERSTSGRLIAAYMFPLGSTRDLGVMAKYSLPNQLGQLYLSATNGLGSGPSAQVGGEAINRKNIRAKEASGMVSAALALEPLAGLTFSLAATVNDISHMTDAEGNDSRIDRNSAAAGIRYDAPYGWLDAEYTTARKGAADIDGRDEMNGYYMRAAAWLIDQRLDLILRHCALERGVEAKARDSDYSVALRLRHKQFEALAEYIRADGADGSFYGPTDPWALAVRLGVRF